jgi:hypothetical protein
MYSKSSNNFKSLYSNPTQNDYKSSRTETKEDHAYISCKKRVKNYSPTSISGNPISMRSSLTYYSTIFTPIDNFQPKRHPNKPKDNLSSGFFGSDKPEYYRKSIVSDFIPNFQPNYKPINSWKIDPYGNALSPLPQSFNNEITPVKNKNLNISISPRLEDSYIKVFKSPASIRGKLACTTSSSPANCKSLSTTQSSKNIFHCRTPNSKPSNDYFNKTVERSTFEKNIFHRLPAHSPVFAIKTWNRLASKSRSQSYMKDTISYSKKRLILDFN